MPASHATPMIQAHSTQKDTVHLLTGNSVHLGKLNPPLTSQAHSSSKGKANESLCTQ